LGDRFPAMGPKRRSADVAELDTAIERHQAAIEALTPVVGDPEDVVWPCQPEMAPAGRFDLAPVRWSRDVRGARRLA
jgi:hypothetical protein